MTFGAPLPAAFVQVEEVPGSGVAVHVGAHVEATDGRVGKVDEFLVDRKSSAITHVVLHQGHLWGKRSISVPVSAIDRIEALRESFGDGAAWGESLRRELTSTV